MAKLNNIFKIDSFFTDTRINVCLNINCKHNMTNKKGRHTGLYCHFRYIDIGDDGKCKNFEVIKDKEIQTIFTCGKKKPYEPDELSRTMGNKGKGE